MLRNAIRYLLKLFYLLTIILIVAIVFNLFLPFDRDFFIRNIILLVVYILILIFLKMIYERISKSD
jgi:hypothetical protein